MSLILSEGFAGVNVCVFCGGFECVVDAYLTLSSAMESGPLGRATCGVCVGCDTG